jgi:hypothetical protein
MLLTTSSPQGASSTQQSRCTTDLLYNKFVVCQDEKTGTFRGDLAGRQYAWLGICAPVLVGHTSGSRALRLPMHRAMVISMEILKRREISVTRIVPQRGERRASEQSEWANYSMEERIAAVWELTLAVWRGGLPMQVNRDFRNLFAELSAASAESSLSVRRHWLRMATRRIVSPLCSSRRP